MCGISVGIHEERKTFAGPERDYDDSLVMYDNWILFIVIYIGCVYLFCYSTPDGRADTNCLLIEDFPWNPLILQSLRMM